MLAILKYWQLILGAVGCLVLGFMLMTQKGETRHFKKLYGQETDLYNGEVSALGRLETSYRLASATAIENNQKMLAKANAANAARNEKSSNDYETRVADINARYQRLRDNAKATSANPGSGSGLTVPGISITTRGTFGATRPLDALARDQLCVVQAIRLDELQKWVRDAASKNEKPGDNVAH